jgi:hypothetical protein
MLLRLREEHLKQDLLIGAWEQHVHLGRGWVGRGGWWQLCCSELLREEDALCCGHEPVTSCAVVSRAALARPDRDETGRDMCRGAVTGAAGKQVPHPSPPRPRGPVLQAPWATVPSSWMPLSS